MKQFKTTISTLFFLLFFTAIMGSTIEAHPFKVGEKLTYKVRFIGFLVGKQILEVKDIVQVNGHSTYLFTSTLKSVGLASLFYHFDEEIESFADVNTLYPRRSIIHSNEGAEIHLEVNPEKGIAVIENKKIKYTWQREFSLPVLEAVSLTYWLRAHDLRVGEEFCASFIEAQKIRKLTVKVLAKEKVYTPIGSFTAFLCSEVASPERKVWFSDDERRLPVKFQAQTSFGVITAYLSEIESAE